MTIKLNLLLTKELLTIYSHFEKGCWKECTRQPRKVIIMGYDQYTFSDTVAVEPITFVAFLLSTRKHTSMTSRAILSLSFFEEQ